jgi:hypothetical protein
LKSYTATRAFRTSKDNRQQQTLRSVAPLTNGKVTVVKIKLVRDHVFVFGVSNPAADISQYYVGRTEGTYGFGCEDGKRYTYSL